MLNTVYKDAIVKRDKMLAVLKGPEFGRIITKARENWTDYAPTKRDVVTAGIDSSFNSTKFQGIELWAVTAVSVKADGTVLCDLHDSGLGPDADLSGMASRLEIEACQKTIDHAEMVLMDGSFYSQVMSRQAAKAAPLISAIQRRNNVIFVAKTSNTKKQFENMGSLAGDIFYYNHVTTKPGYSKVFVEGRYGEERAISSTFVRLSESTPIIKVELLGKGYSDQDIKDIMDRLCKTSVGGYPYALKLAHNNCKISDRELAKMTSLLGLGNEVGSREVLG